MTNTNTLEQMTQSLQKDITITKGDLSCFVAGILEVVEGTANTFYDLSREGVYEQYGAGTSLADMDGRARSAQRFFEASYDVTAGALHLSEIILRLLWSEWDNLTSDKQSKEQTSAE